MPVLVNPVVMKDTMADVKLGMEILVGPDEITLQKKKTKFFAAETEVQKFHEFLDGKVSKLEDMVVSTMTHVERAKDNRIR